MNPDVENSGPVSPSPGDELKLNLTFASIDDLVEELKRRCPQVLIAWVRPAKADDGIDEDTDEPYRNCDFNQVTWQGGWHAVLGLCEVIKHKILNE